MVRLEACREFFYRVEVAVCVLADDCSIDDAAFVVDAEADAAFAVDAEEDATAFVVVVVDAEADDAAGERARASNAQTMADGLELLVAAKKTQSLKDRVCALRLDLGERSRDLRDVFVAFAMRRSGAVNAQEREREREREICIYTKQPVQTVKVGRAQHEQI